MALRLTSATFSHNALIPKQFTCDGRDFSPALSWEGVPDGAKSLVLIMDDNDVPRSLVKSGMWDHWVLFNIPPHVAEFAEGIATLPSGTKEGKNSWGNLGYGGPCPPDREHRYFFKLYALDQELSLEKGATKQQVEQAMQEHIIESAELMGRYNRPGNQ